MVDVGAGLLHFLLRNLHGIFLRVEWQGLCYIDLMDVVKGLLEVDLVLVAREPLCGRNEMLGMKVTALLPIGF